MPLKCINVRLHFHFRKVKFVKIFYYIIYLLHYLLRIASTVYQLPPIAYSQINNLTEICANVLCKAL